MALRDMHNRRAIDLLVMDKMVMDVPSATQIREEVIMEKREGLLITLNSRFYMEEERIKNITRRELLDECIQMAEELSDSIWHVSREASTLLQRYLPTQWTTYEDPDSGNLFHCFAPAKATMGEEYSYYSWSEPEHAKAIIDRTKALQYQIRYRSTVLRKHQVRPTDIHPTIHYIHYIHYMHYRVYTIDIRISRHT